MNVFCALAGAGKTAGIASGATSTVIQCWWNVQREKNNREPIMGIRGNLKREDKAENEEG